MKMISFSFFILTIWIFVLTFAYCKLKDDYNTSQAEVERYRQMLEIASVDISKFINCKPSDYLHDLGTRDYYEEIK